MSLFNLSPLISIFSPKRKLYYSIYQILGYFPKNIELYELAFTHKSAIANFKKQNIKNNERLEYLGDAILDAVIADFLYSKFPEYNEGILTKMRSKIVNREFLNNLAYLTKINNLIQINKKNNSIIDNIYGNAVEALIGAIYLDKGYETAKKIIINKFINNYVDLEVIENNDTNFKSKVLELSQKYKFDTKFTTEEIMSQENYHLFITYIKIGEEIYGTGTGNSKKESEQKASEQALLKLDFIP